MSGELSPPIASIAIEIFFCHNKYIKDLEFFFRYKGQILNQIATKMMKYTEDLVPNWLIDTPDPNVAIGHLCKPFKVEMVIRGYMSGHSAREYKAGKRILCGAEMPDGLNENDAFKSPIITPATKAEMGNHDEDISREDILKRGIVSEEDYIILEDYTRKLFKQQICFVHLVLAVKMSLLIFYQTQMKLS